MTRVFDRPAAEKAMYNFLKALGEDMDDPNLRETPQRVTKMYCEELLKGHTFEPSLKSFTTKDVGSQFIVMTDLHVASLCCHHLMPVTGVAHIGAFFKEKDTQETDLPGLSKYQRIVDKYARRLQLQERMTNEIAEEVVRSLKADWAMVYVRAKHFCMVHRGVQSPNAQTATSVISNPNLSQKQSDKLRKDFLTEIRVR